MTLSGLLGQFISAVASGLWTFLAVSCGLWMLDGTKSAKKSENNKENNK